MKIKKQLFRFTIAGIVVLLVDAATYSALLFFASPWHAKVIAFIFGTITSYALNKIWSFENTDSHARSWPKFATLYGLTLLLNVGINSLMIIITGNVPLSYLVATGTSTITNFIGQKYWVFKTKTSIPLPLP